MGKQLKWSSCKCEILVQMNNNSNRECVRKMTNIQHREFCKKKYGGLCNKCGGNST